MDENNRAEVKKSSAEILRDALIKSVIYSASRAEEIGMEKSKIILSAKVSNVSELIKVYTSLAEKTVYPLHLGLTEAGMGMRGIVSSVSALSILINQNIGDTIRVSLTPRPNENRIEEVKVAKKYSNPWELGLTGLMLLHVLDVVEQLQPYFKSLRLILKNILRKKCRNGVNFMSALIN